jgi:hypothetical protein
MNHLSKVDTFVKNPMVFSAVFMFNDITVYLVSRMMRGKRK